MIKTLFLPLLKFCTTHALSWFDGYRMFTAHPPFVTLSHPLHTQQTIEARRASTTKAILRHDLLATRSSSSSGGGGGGSSSPHQSRVPPSASYRSIKSGQRQSFSQEEDDDVDSPATPSSPAWDRSIDVDMSVDSTTEVNRSSDRYFSRSLRVSFADDNDDDDGSARVDDSAVSMSAATSSSRSSHEKNSYSKWVRRGMGDRLS